MSPLPIRVVSLDFSHFPCGYGCITLLATVHHQSALTSLPVRPYRAQALQTRTACQRYTKIEGSEHQGKENSFYSHIASFGRSTPSSPRRMRFPLVSRVAKPERHHCKWWKWERRVEYGRTMGVQESPGSSGRRRGCRVL